MDLERKRKTLNRWYILQALYAAGSTGVRQALILECVTDEDTQLTNRELEHSLGYLVQSGLVTRGQEELYFITQQGYDVAEYNVEPPPGVKRPPKRY